MFHQFVNAPIYNSLYVLAPSDPGSQKNLTAGFTRCFENGDIMPPFGEDAGGFGLDALLGDSDTDKDNKQ